MLEILVIAVVWLVLLTWVMAMLRAAALGDRDDARRLADERARRSTEEDRRRAERVA